MTVKHFIRRILAIILLVCLPATMLLAASESYIQTLTGNIKQGDSCVVIDDKFLHLSLDEWNKIQHLSVDNLISFELRFDTSVYFQNRSFTCTLNVSVKYFTSRDQTVPDEINNVDLVVKYDTAKGAFYPADAHYKFKNAFKVVVVVNSITSKEWGNNIPAIFRLKNQILVERKYPFDPHAKGAMTIALQNNQPATASPLLRTLSVKTNITTGGNSNQLFISWNPADFNNPEEYDIEWTFIDGLSTNGALIASTYGNGSSLPPGKAEEWMKNDNTRVTLSTSSYTINLPYPDGYVLVRVRGVSYQLNTNLRLLGDWDYDNGNGYAVCEPVIAHESGLNWQYTGVFAEEGKRKEVITYYDASLRNRQAITINNSDKTLVPNSTIDRQETAVVQETIYDQMGRPAVNILPAPINSKSLKYYPGFNVDNSNEPFSHKNIRLNINCMADADPLNTSSGASRYYSPNNSFINDNEYYFTKHVPDAQQYPYSLTEYAPDNTGQIRRQSGVGPKLRIANGLATQYFSAKPKQKELDRLFGVEAGDCSHYLKNMVIDPNGQASVSYIDANGKTVATALAGPTPQSVDALPSAAASAATMPFDEQLISGADFRRDGTEMIMKATATFMAADKGTFDLHYSVNPSALTTTHHLGQFCSDCYYEVLVEVRNDCGRPYGSATSTAFTMNDVTCNPNAAPITGSINVIVDEVGTYNVTYTLRLSQQVVNYQTEYYLQHNSDLKTLQAFFEEKLRDMDLAGCYSSCESCKTLGNTPDAFRQKVWDLLATDKFSGVQASSEVNLWINDTWNDLKAKCNSLSCGVTSACEDYLVQMKADVRPGGQYALTTYDEAQDIYSYSERSINVLRFYNLNSADNSEIYNFSYTNDDGLTVYIRDLSESDFIKAYMYHPDWADMFVKKHIEYCGYLFCKDQSYSASNNNEASFNFDKTLRERVATGDDAQSLGYYVPGNMFALVNLDPFFNGGRGSSFKTNMNGDLVMFSGVIGFLVKDANGNVAPTKNISDFIDWMLYAKPASSDPATWLNSWNSPNFNSVCRSNTMEWEMYRNYYLQLKSKYVQKVKEQMAPDCVNCFVGQDALAKSDDCLPPDQSQYSIAVTDNRSGPTYAIVYQNGNTPFPSDYKVNYQYTKSGVVYNLSTVVPEGQLQWNIYDSYLGAITDMHIVSVVCPKGYSLIACNNEEGDPGTCPDVNSFYVDDVTMNDLPSTCSYNNQQPNPPIILSDGSVFVIDELLLPYSSLYCHFSLHKVYYVHPGGPVKRPVIIQVMVARRLAPPNNSSFNKERYYTVTLQPGQDRVLLGYDQYGYAGSDVGYTLGVTLSVQGITCQDYYIPTPSTCRSNPLYADYAGKSRVFNEYVNVEGYTKCMNDNPQPIPSDAEILEQFRNNAIQDLPNQEAAWIERLKAARDAEPAFSGITDGQIKIIGDACFYVALTNIQQAASPQTIRAASNFPNAAPQGVNNSFADIFIAKVGATLFQQGFSQDLLDRPYPYDKTPVDVNPNLGSITSDNCTNLNLLKTRYTASGFSGSFYDYLKQELGDDMVLTSTQLQDLLDKCTAGCSYTNESVILPAALAAVAPANSDHPFISCSRMTSLKAQFANTYLGVNVGSDLYYTLFTNFCNHNTGYALTYDDYDGFSQKCNINSTAVLYNKPASPVIPVDDFKCQANSIATAFEQAGQDYEQYIAAERQRFRNLYISKCLATQAEASIKGQQVEYHFTLYYYDQSGNLVKTIPPEGVRLLTDEQIEQVKNIRNTGNATCTDDGITKEQDKNVVFNAFSAQIGTTKSLELLLSNVDAINGSQVRFITPDNKYMYQAAIADKKLWVELYSLQPGTGGTIDLVLTNQAVADISSFTIQQWSQVVVQSNNFAGDPWDVYFNGAKLTLLPNTSAPGYPLPWEIAAGFTLPTAETTILKYLRLYSNTLSPAEVSYNYTNPCLQIASSLQGMNSPLLIWGKFDNASLCNPITETASTANPGALQINGDLGFNAGTQMNVTNNFTVELWVNPQQIHEIDPESQTGTPGVIGQKYAIFPTHGGNAAAGDAGMGISVGTNGVSVYEHADNYMPALLVWNGAISGWTHVAVVYNNKVPSLYINGRLVRTGLQSTKQNISPSYNFGYDGGYGYMPGAIDEVRIWSVVRTPQQILDNYQQAVVPSAVTGLAGYWPMDPANGSLLTDISCTNTNNVPLTSGYSWTTDCSNITGIAISEQANNFIVPQHGMPTYYQYNSMNQVVKQTSPDGGTTRFWYDRLGKLSVSQNEEQLQPKVQGATPNRYSYTKYDAFDRIVEVGEKVNAGSAITEADSRDNASLQTWMQSGQNSQITQTIYDVAPAYAPGLLTNLRKRVAASIVLQGAVGSPRTSGTYYSYDYIGNVKTYFQENSKLLQFDAATGIKRIDYDYDLVSGKVNKVKYQEGKGDQFYYQYRYDADNRIVNAETSRDGLIWNTEAAYRYYLHGPLARTELGQNKVQGLDYAYTLQGWMKGINSQQLDASKDMSQDGYAGSNFPWVARDVMGFSLGYFSGDYQPIDNSATAFGMAYQPPVAFPNTESGNELFNGNISNATLALSKLNNGALKGYTYRYDQLNRLKQMRMHGLSAGGSNWGNGSILPNYQEDIIYDGNGNIQTYQRNGDVNNGTVGYKMDDLTYNYNRTPDGYLINNKLRHVNDGVNAAYYATDIDDQSSDYYTYDKIGNLIAEGNENVSWNLYGKIKDISNAGQTIHYTYDAAGNRISKAVTSGSTTKYTFYVRDPQNNVLGVYTDESNTLKWTEQHLYGSKRLGVWHPNIDVTSIWQAPGTGNGQINIGEREYELTNHLGNVLTTINDNKTGIDAGNGTIDHYEANVLSASDYYPFGMQMPGRIFNSGSYRYGFNGKENDNEIKGDGNQQDYGMRIYDPRVGRFLSVDPLTKNYPGLTPYQFASNRPIDGIDLDGEEWRPYTNWLADKINANGYPRIAGLIRGLGAGDYQAEVKQFVGNLARGNLKEAAEQANGYTITGSNLNMIKFAKKVFIDRDPESQGQAVTMLAFGWFGGRAATEGPVAPRVSTEPVDPMITKMSNPLTEPLPSLSKGKTVGLAIDESLYLHRRTGAITYKDAGWQQAGLTKVDWGKVYAGDEFAIKESFRDAVKNADAIRFDVTDFDPFYYKPGITNYEFNYINSDPAILGKTTYIRNGAEVIWDGKKFINK